MPAPQNLRAAGERIEQLLDQLQSTADPASYRRAEELVRLVTELYGAGLERVMAMVGQRAPQLVGALAGDELVASLLVVHGLHPESVAARLDGALAAVRPLLAGHGGDVEVLEVDEGAGSVRIRLLGTCDGCPSSSVTLQLAVERAIGEAVPEIVRIEVEQPSAVAAPVPVALGTKPMYEECPGELASR